MILIVFEIPGWKINSTTTTRSKASFVVNRIKSFEKIHSTLSTNWMILILFEIPGWKIYSTTTTRSKLVFVVKCFKRFGKNHSTLSTNWMFLFWLRFLVQKSTQPHQQSFEKIHSTQSTVLICVWKHSAFKAIFLKNVLNHDN